jgi:hypothetical protein
MMRVGLRVLSLMVVMGLLVGCGDGDKTKTDDKTKTGDKTTTATETDADSLAFANTKCPIMGGDVDTEGVYTMVDGEKIGYCCEPCKEKFEELSPEEQQAKLASAGQDASDGGT